MIICRSYLIKVLEILSKDLEEKKYGIAKSYLTKTLIDLKRHRGQTKKILVNHPVSREIDNNFIFEG